MSLEELIWLKDINIDVISFPEFVDIISYLVNGLISLVVITSTKPFHCSLGFILRKLVNTTSEWLDSLSKTSQQWTSITCFPNWKSQSVKQRS